MTAAWQHRCGQITCFLPQPDTEAFLVTRMHPQHIFSSFCLDTACNNTVFMHHDMKTPTQKIQTCRCQAALEQLERDATQRLALRMSHFVLWVTAMSSILLQATIGFKAGRWNGLPESFRLTCSIALSISVLAVVTGGAIDAASFYARALPLPHKSIVLKQSLQLRLCGRPRAANGLVFMYSFFFHHSFIYLQMTEASGV
jgi:hypothetical protein